ncbi:BC1872 family protein [Brevibacillus panacihumi]|uniref:BC1872 family protein n=1 Tax=Brevibacillus panacihumi TaxID=497735 RepID=UPI003D21FA6C
MGIEYRRIGKEPTEQQIIETLATKVMGWGREIRFRSDEDEVGDYVWAVPETGEVMALEYKWNPLQNIADAWMIVEKLKQIRPIHDVRRHNFQAIIRGSIYDIMPEEICKAAIAAIGEDIT